MLNESGKLLLRFVGDEDNNLALRKDYVLFRPYESGVSYIF